MRSSRIICDKCGISREVGSFTPKGWAYLHIKRSVIESFAGRVNLGPDEEYGYELCPTCLGALFEWVKA